MALAIEDSKILRRVLGGMDKDKQRNYVVSKSPRMDACYLCGRSFHGEHGLRVHLGTCIPNFLCTTTQQKAKMSGKKDHEKVSPKPKTRSAGSRTRREDKTKSRQDFIKMRHTLRRMNKDQQKDSIVDLSPSVGVCYLCDSPFSGEKGLRIHLSTCIPSFLSDNQSLLQDEKGTQSLGKSYEKKDTQSNKGITNTSHTLSEMNEHQQRDYIVNLSPAIGICLCDLTVRLDYESIWVHVCQIFCLPSQDRKVVCVRRYRNTLKVIQTLKI